MRTHTAVSTLALTALFVLVGLNAPLLAYVDLGSGSYMLQLLAAGGLGMIFAARNLWAKVRAFFAKSEPRHPR